MTRALVVAVLGASVLAQEPERHAPPLERPIVERLLLEVTSRLGSDKPESVAWGAYLAGRFGLTEAVPQVRQALARDHGDGTEGRLTRLYLLDAVARLDGTAPAEVLKANAKGITLPPSLIVMARQPVANEETLRELFSEHAGLRGDPMAWRVAGNVLAAQKARGFAAHLLQSTRFDLHLIVTDQEDLQVGIGARRVRIDPRRDHLRWLEAMAGRELFGDELSVSSHRMVVFEDREQFTAAVADLRKGMHDAFGRALEKLVDASVLTSDETRGLSLDLKVTLHDQRRDKSVELPPADSGR